MVKGIRVGNPPGEADFFGNPQVGGQFFEALHLLTVPCDEKPQRGVFCMGSGEAPDQGGDVLDRIQPGGNAGDDASVIGVQPHRTEEGGPVHGGSAGGEIQPVVNGEKSLRIKPPVDQQIHHGVRYPDAVVQLSQGNGIDGAVGDPGQGAAQVVQPVVTVDGGYRGQSGPLGQEGRHHVASGAVAVDDVKALRLYHVGQCV